MLRQRVVQLGRRPPAVILPRRQVGNPRFQGRFLRSIERRPTRLPNGLFLRPASFARGQGLFPAQLFPCRLGQGRHRHPPALSRQQLARRPWLHPWPPLPARDCPAWRIVPARPASGLPLGPWPPWPRFARRSARPWLRPTPVVRAQWPLARFPTCWPAAPRHRLLRRRLPSPLGRARPADHWHGPIVF